VSLFSGRTSFTNPVIQKCVELVKFDETVPTTDIPLAELSRPHQEFKEDAKKNNTLWGRKLKEKNKKQDTKLTNWFNPFI
jgi:hypothetical protein